VAADARNGEALSASQRRAEIRTVIAMTVPGVVTYSSKALMDVTDYVMVTWLRSEPAQAAILSAQMILWCYTVLGVGVVTLVSTFASQALGRGERRECSANSWQGLYVSGVWGLAALVLQPFLPGLFAWIGHEPAVQAQELAYAGPGLYMIGPTVASTSLAAFFIGIHRPNVAMWSVLESNIVNIVVNAVLMFGLLGVEPMGIAGAAWGTVAAVTYRTIRLGLCMCVGGVARTYEVRRSWRPSALRLKNLLRVGLPSGGLWVSDVIVWTVFVTLIIGRTFGTVDLIATNTAWQYLRISFLPAAGAGQALSALVGKSVGAGDLRRARREARFVALLTFAYMGSLSVVYWLAGPQLIGLFNNDPDVVFIGARIMVCAGLFQLFDAFGITYVAALRGAGDTFAPSMVLIVSTWLMVAGAGWAVAVAFPQFGSLGPWTVASALIILAAAYLWWRWHSGRWSQAKVFA
jgi:MATE family multidrug resistance protein